MVGVRNRNIIEKFSTVSLCPRANAIQRGGGGGGGGGGGEKRGRGRELYKRHCRSKKKYMDKWLIALKEPEPKRHGGNLVPYWMSSTRASRRASSINRLALEGSSYEATAFQLPPNQPINQPDFAFHLKIDEFHRFYHFSMPAHNLPFVTEASGSLYLSSVIIFHLWLSQI